MGRNILIMAGSREVRNKIKSVKNTQKITRAMEMVAASKMRKAQDRMKKARPYGEKIRNVAAHMSRANTEYRHPFLIERDTVKRIGIIVVTSDKGLCGGLNTNVLRKAINQMKAWQARDSRSAVSESYLKERRSNSFKKLASWVFKRPSLYSFSERN